MEDFDFYEQREKALQENRRQQHAASTDTQKLVDIKAQDVVADISDAFAKAVRLKNTENCGTTPKTEGASAEKGSAATTKVEGSAGSAGERAVNRGGGAGVGWLVEICT